MARLVFVALHMLVVEQLVVALPGAAPHIDEEPPSLPSIDVKRPVPTLEGQPKPPTKVDPDMLAEIKSKLKAMPPPGIKPKIPQIPKDFDIADLKEKLKDLTAPKPSIDDLRNVKARSSSRGSGLLGRGSGSGSAPAKPQLEYDLAKFIEVYVPGWGSEAPNTARGMPDDKPIHNPEHPDFDPFEIPMPTLKQEWDPKAAFEAMDKDGDGKVRGSEFRAISESGMFNVISAEKLKGYAIFGMGKELFVKLHADEISAAGLDPHELFGEHDKDDNDRLTKEEWNRALSRLRGGDL